MSRARNETAEDLILLAAGAVAAVWRWRLELVLVAVPLLGWRLLARDLGPVVAAAIVVAAIVIVPMPAAARHALVRCLKAARVRRRWRRAWVDVGLPRVKARRVRQVPAGELVRIRCSRGSSIPHVARHAEQLAACLGGA